MVRYGTVRHGTGCGFPLGTNGKVDSGDGAGIKFLQSVPSRFPFPVGMIAVKGHANFPDESPVNYKMTVQYITRAPVGKVPAATLPPGQTHGKLGNGNSSRTFVPIRHRMLIPHPGPTTDYFTVVLLCTSCKSQNRVRVPCPSRPINCRHTRAVPSPYMFVANTMVWLPLRTCCRKEQGIKLLFRDKHRSLATHTNLTLCNAPFLY